MKTKNYSNSNKYNQEPDIEVRNTEGQLQYIDKYVNEMAIQQVLGGFMKDPTRFERFSLVPERDIQMQFHRLLYNTIYNMYKAGNTKQIFPEDVEDYILTSQSTVDKEIYTAHDGGKSVATVFGEVIRRKDDNFEANYMEVCKWSILRGYALKGIDVSYFYTPCELISADEPSSYGRMREEHFTTYSLSEMTDYFSKRISDVNFDYSDLLDSYANKKFTFEPMSPDNWPEELKQQPDYWIEGMLHKNTFDSVVAAAKMGKSLLAYQMAYHIHNGIDFLGCRTKKGNVLYLDFELSEPDIWRRIELLHNQFDEQAKNERNITCTAFPLQRVPGEAVVKQGISNFVNNHVVPYVMKNNIDVIFFDCFFRFAEGDQNSAEDVTKTLAAIKKLQDTYGKTVIYITHSNKSGAANVQDLIYAAGGSGVHGQMVDETYVIMHDSKKEHCGSDDYYKIITTGRSLSKKIIAKRNEATNHQFVRDTTEEPVVIEENTTVLIDESIPEEVPVDPKKDHYDLWKALGKEGKAIRTLIKDPRFNDLTIRSARLWGFTIEHGEKILRP